MSNTPIQMQCQMLCACACAYNIVGTTYSPPASDPYGPQIGWTTATPPIVVTGGIENEDAALVGIINLADGNNTPAIVVAFEGTVPPALNLDSILAWLQNLIAEPVYEANLHGQVHKGIYESVNNIFNSQWSNNNILGAIASLQNSGYADAPLYITGHSKGGGMASICAAMIYWMANDTLQPTALYTFASPMIGDAEFQSNFPSIPVYRTENNLDIVPFLPASTNFIATLKNAEVNSFPDYTLVLDALVDMLNLACDDGNWPYVPLPQYQVYFLDGTTDNLLSSNPCAPDIASTIAQQGLSGLETVINAHSHLCGGIGYMNATCNNMGVCPIA